MSEATERINELAENKTLFIKGFFWAKPRIEDSLYSIKAPDIEISFSYPGMGNASELMWPVQALYNVSVKDVSEFGPEGIAQTLSAEMLRNREITTVTAYLPIPMHSADSPEEAHFRVCGYFISKQINGDFMIMMKNNGNVIEVAYILRGGEENMVLGKLGEDEDTAELIAFDPLPTADLLARKRQEEPDTGRLVIVALPVIADEIKADGETDSSRNLTLFNLTFVGVTKDTTPEDFRKAVNALESMGTRPIDLQ